jgi:hypothetical protein
MDRPVPDREVPEGYELVAVVDEGCRVEDGKRCRFGGGYHHKACGLPSVMAFRSGRQWWAYCSNPEHMFGRWIEAGKVMHWILRAKAS